MKRNDVHQNNLITRNNLSNFSSGLSRSESLLRELGSIFAAKVKDTVYYYNARMHVYISFVGDTVTCTCTNEAAKRLYLARQDLLTAAFVIPFVPGDAERSAVKR